VSLSKQDLQSPKAEQSLQIPNSQAFLPRQYPDVGPLDVPETHCAVGPHQPQLLLVVQVLHEVKFEQVVTFVEETVSTSRSSLASESEFKTNKRRKPQRNNFILFCGVNSITFSSNPILF